MTRERIRKGDYIEVPGAPAFYCLPTGSLHTTRVYSPVPFVVQVHKVGLAYQEAVPPTQWWQHWRDSGHPRLVAWLSSGHLCWTLMDRVRRVSDLELLAREAPG